MTIRLVEMAKLVLLLVFVCFQFSRPEELEKVEPELINDEIPVKELEVLDGADTKQWQYQKEEDLDSDEDWTEEDEKWLQGIQELLKESSESDEDYDFESEDFNKVMEEIDKYFDEKYPGESKDKWLPNSDDWLDEDDDYWDLEFSKYPDFIKKEEDLSVVSNGKDDLDLYYAWLYRMQIRNAKKKSPVAKRFSSV